MRLVKYSMFTCYNVIFIIILCRVIKIVHREASSCKNMAVSRSIACACSCWEKRPSLEKYKIKLKCKPTMISKGDNESWSTPRSCMIPLDSKGVTFYGLCSTPLGAVISLQLRLRVSKDLLNGHACTMPSRPPVCSIMHGLNFILLKREQCIIIQMNAYFQE